MPMRQFARIGFGEGVFAARSPLGQVIGGSLRSMGRSQRRFGSRRLFEQRCQRWQVFLQALCSGSLEYMLDQDPTHDLSVLDGSAQFSTIANCDARVELVQSTRVAARPSFHAGQLGSPVSGELLGEFAQFVGLERVAQGSQGSASGTLRLLAGPKRRLLSNVRKNFRARRGGVGHSSLVCKRHTEGSRVRGTASAWCLAKPMHPCKL